MVIKTYNQAIRYLESFIGKIYYKIDPQYLKHHDPLDRMRILLSLLDNPQNKFPSVLIGGTSGKGSTAYLTSHILQTAGYKTGLTISPHLQKINERIQINGQQISDKEFTKLVNSIVQTIELMKTTKVGAPSYFEILIAMAFLYFVQQKVDIAVVEVGMGGEYDATNTLNPLISVLTNVSLDHTNILGKTVEKIAKTKAGIIKSIKHKVLSSKCLRKNLTVVSGVEQKSVVKIVKNQCKKTRATLHLLHKDFNYKITKEDINGVSFDFKSEKNNLKNLHTSLLGEFQVNNASLAIKTALELTKYGFNISENNIRKALNTAYFPGRFEYLIHNTKYKILLDGAHNPAKMEAFLRSLKKLFPKEKKIFVVAFKEDKDIKVMINKIFKIADAVILAQFQAKTDMKQNASADAFNIKNEILNIKYNKEIFVEKNSKKALQKALNILISQYSNIPSIVVVTGSLYLVGEIRNML